MSLDVWPSSLQPKECGLFEVEPAVMQDTGSSAGTEVWTTQLLKFYPSCLLHVPESSTHSIRTCHSTHYPHYSCLWLARYSFLTHYKTPPLRNLCLKLCHVYVPEWRPRQPLFFCLNMTFSARASDCPSTHTIHSIRSTHASGCSTTPTNPIPVLLWLPDCLTAPLLILIIRPILLHWLTCPKGIH